MLKREYKGKEIIVYYIDGTSDRISAATVVDWKEENPNGFGYVEYYSQHISKIMTKKSLLFTVKTPKNDRSNKCALPINLERIINTEFVKKIEII